MPASPSTARAINDRLALRLLQDEGPLTAGQLKTMTGLSRPTVADLVERLQESGLVRVVGETGARRRGPNARLYGIAADRAHLAALDVRLRSVSVVVTDLVGETLAEATLPMGDGTGTGPAVERAASLLESTARKAGVGHLHTVGIGAPGLIDPATSELRDSTGLPAWHRRLVTVLQERLPATVLVENETNLAAVAEQRQGAARDRDTFVLLWLGHGVGAAVVLDGRLRRGASGGAGEIGFLPVPGTAGLPSATDCDGGFHSLAGSSAIRDLAREYGFGAAEGNLEPSGASAVRAALAGGPSPRGDAFLDALADRLALGVAAVSSVLDPGCVVLGGETGHAGGAALAGRVEKRLAALTPLRTEVRASGLGGAAVLRGALFMSRDAAQDELFPGGA
ncbi:ROK family transcriptional regulator [Streptomyces sp. SP18CS02]|uniref:ROK family transcriptional regulator n=1 Tax=Streptomyces sp. SP18CS02 TaxID=3002531 RepID=UPI002E7A0D09|nr:ROK family transcriptional regulator [Streptomyces sp. SP18CS02]MEE1751459.1 ROK family transcriptional regulator [Streptomyces sp. SP18CS02]